VLVEKKPLQVHEKVALVVEGAEVAALVTLFGNGVCHPIYELFQAVLPLSLRWASVFCIEIPEEVLRGHDIDGLLRPGFRKDHGLLLEDGLSGFRVFNDCVVCRPLYRLIRMCAMRAESTCMF